MKAVLIFGAGRTGQKIYEEIKNDCKVIAFLDNNEKYWGEEVDGCPIIGDAKVCDTLEYDEIIVGSLLGMNAMREQLLAGGVPATKINTGFCETEIIARNNFIKNYSKTCGFKRDEEVCVAEGGVFQGEFAKKINAYFPTNTLYLFDTFEGFDARDVKVEKERNFSVSEEAQLNMTNQELVLEKMLYKEKVVIQKGYFPETTIGLENKKFGFVNLDFDLYKPTLEGLRFFYPKLVKGGCILIHDYYNAWYKGVGAAIEKFEEEYGEIIKFPIGDDCSLGILKM